MRDFLLSALFIISTLTSLTVQGIKILLDEQGIKYKSNVLAISVSVILSVGTMAFYGYYYEFNPDLIATTLALCFFSALGSMTSYDKVRQMIEQIYREDD